MKTVVSIQSQLVFGYAGNSAAVPVLQSAGLTVYPVPTTLLSNTPDYPEWSSMPVRAEDVRALCAGLNQRVEARQLDVVLTGWMGSAAIVREVAQWLVDVKRQHPGLLYVCDPVMGDSQKGLYVDAACAQAIAEELVPLADVLTPNTFELQRLVPQEATLAGRMAALSGERQRIIVVSSVPDEHGGIVNVVGRGSDIWQVRTPRLDVDLSGTGDVMTARFLVSLLRGAALEVALADSVSGVYAVIELAAATDAHEMPLTQAMPAIQLPTRRFPATRRQP
ncbi:pyridoxal kinase [Kerstersia similis]|uniref:pyridoxal kinase n=1 Tax=Kerstersia similis TaxID=206505 RepID=UPI0039F08FCE